MKKYFITICLLLIFISTLYANDDTSLYINGLESIIKEDNQSAKESFNLLVNQFPSSQYKVKANDFLFDLNNKVDNSGIVPFYLGNLATLSYTSLMVLDLFNIDQNSLSIGLSGLTGVGLALSSSYLLSKDQPISSELYFRIITNQIVSMGNFFYLQAIAQDYNLFNNDYNLEDKVLLSTQLATLNSSLYLSFFTLKNKELEKGKGLFALQAYAWSNFYYWLSNIIFDNQITTNTMLMALAISDIAYFGSLPIWNQIKWSSSRSGLVSVGGLGGALIGLFTTMILDDIVGTSDKTTAAIVMGTALGGKILTTYLTRNLDIKKNNKIASNNMLIPYPIFTSNNEIGIGFNYFI